MLEHTQNMFLKNTIVYKSYSAAKLYRVHEAWAVKPFERAKFDAFPPRPFSCSFATFLLRDCRRALMATTNNKIVQDSQCHSSFKLLVETPRTAVETSKL